MSTKFYDFRKLLGADPWSRDAETLRARRAGPEFEAAARDAEQFEKKLEAALLVPAPGDLLDEIGRASCRERV